jgi:hypothetical protein
MLEPGEQRDLVEVLNDRSASGELHEPRFCSSRRTRLTVAREVPSPRRGA